MKSFFQSFSKDQSGQALTEYALILFIVAIAVVGALTLFKDQIIDVFNDISSTLGGGGEESA